MIGSWEEEAVVTCNNPLVRASVFKGEKESLIAIANWSEDEQLVALKIDFNQLGLDMDNHDLFIPDITDFQEAQAAIDLNNLTLPGGKGFIIVLRKGI